MERPISERGFTLIELMVVLAMTGWTLWLSWQLEGAAAAINDTGSLRMRANLIGIGLLQPGAALAPREAMRQQHGRCECLLKPTQ